MTDYETLDYAVDDGILTLTLYRPDQLNAFTVTMAEELVDAFDRASTDDEVRAVVVTGAGRGFCAGMDLAVDGNVFGLDESQEPTLSDLHERLDDPAIIEGVRDTGGRVTLAVYDCTKPVIAAINGPAVGIGATMTLAMDVRLASSAARIGLVFGKIGIVPEACSTWFLPRIVGMSRALELVLRRRHPRRGCGSSTSAWCGQCTSPMSCCPRRTSSRTASPTTARRWRRRSPAR